MNNKCRQDCISLVNFGGQTSVGLFPGQQPTVGVAIAGSGVRTRENDEMMTRAAHY